MIQNIIMYHSKSNKSFSVSLFGAVFIYRYLYYNELVTNNELQKTIEKYLCHRNEGAYGIYELMHKLLLFEIFYEVFNQKILNNDIDGTALESDLLQNFLKIGYIYTQINILCKLFDRMSNTLSLSTLFVNTKNLLPKNSEYEEIQKFLETQKIQRKTIYTNKHIQSIKTARNKIICHNDTDANREILLDIRECSKIAFKIYDYFNKYVIKDFDFLSLKEEAFIDNEIEKLSLPFFKNENDKKLFKVNYIKVLHDFNLNCMTFSDMQKFMQETIKVTIKRL